MKEDTTETDASLVERCLEGDSAAWQSLVLRYQRLIYSVARAYFRNGVADDVFQDVCLELYRRLESVRDVQSLPAWIITVTKRTCGKALANVSDWEDVDSESLADIDQKIPAIENRFWLEQVLDSLSDRDRQLIECLYLDPDQPSYAEISDKLNIPVASIGPTRARSLEKLRAQWEGRQ